MQTTRETSWRPKASVTQRPPTALIAAAAVIALATAAPVASAHPDVFMESRVSLVFDEEGLARLNVELMFEKFFAASARRMADFDRDGKITEADLPIAGALLSIRPDTLASMVFIWIDGQERPVEEIENFQIVQGGQDFGVRFDVPCRVSAGEGARAVAFVVFDDTCFSRVTLAPKESIRLSGHETFDVTVHPPVESERIEIESSGPMNPAYVMSDPMEVRVDFARKSAPVGSQPAATSATAASQTSISFGARSGGGVAQRLMALQQQVRDWLADTNARYQQEGAWGVLALMLGGAFVYGILHATGPGHGKLVVAGYLMTQSAPLSAALVAGVLIPLLHTASGMTVSLTLHFVLARAQPLIGGAGIRSVSEMTSYLLVTLLGVYLLVSTLRRLRRGDAQDAPAAGKLRSPVVLSLAVGLVPCPTTIIIMEIFITHALMLGVLMCAFQAMGMVATVTTIALLTAVGRLSLAKGASRLGLWGSRLMHAVMVLGALLVTALGALLLYAAIGMYHPQWLAAVGLR